MKNKYWQLALMLFFIIGVGFAIIQNKSSVQNQKSKSYPLLPRAGNNNLAEWQMAKNNTDLLIEKLKAKPNDTKTALALANAYIIESRISGNNTYYDMAALKIIKNIIATEPANYQALLLQSLIQLSQHHFAEALSTATKVIAIDSNSAFLYGVLLDANVEMGNYEAAVAAADQMVSIRPDLRSYSRIAYLREIHGDYFGAINAMQLAVKAGIPAEETTEWCRIQLGRLYENIGAIEKARFQYALSLAARPGYAYALAGLGRIASFEKKYDSAIVYYEQASQSITDLGIKEKLAAAYFNAGQTEKSILLNQQLVAEMKMADKNLKDNPDAGHYSDKEQAYVYLQQNNLDMALAHALAEYNRRPKNIDVNETLAWVYYNRNEFKNALPFVDAALITGSRNPQLLCIAGLVYTKTGNEEKGKNFIASALKNKPILSEDILKEIETLK